jgi:hypothetical protein
LPSVYDAIDLSFPWSGDYIIDNGDLKDTSDDGLQSLIDQLHDIVASAIRDWLLYPNRAANIVDDFVGEPNTRATGDSLHDRLRLTIVSAGLVRESDLQVRVIPTHIHEVLIVFRIAAVPTAYNQLAENQFLQVAFVFNSLEQTVFSLHQQPQLLSLGG